jgi:hypothetical protein
MQCTPLPARGGVRRNDCTYLSSCFILVCSLLFLCIPTQAPHTSRMGLDSLTEGADTKLVEINANPPSLSSQPHDRGALRDTSVVNAVSPTGSRLDISDVQTQQNLESAVKSSEREHYEPASQQLRSGLRRLEQGLPRLAPANRESVCPTQSSPEQHECQAPELQRQPDDRREKSSEDNIGDDQQRHMYNSEGQTPFLHGAWVETPNEHEYRHLVTGTIYRNVHSKPPQSPGPTAKDIPDGWEAFLPIESIETWCYVHRASGITIDRNPNLLSKAVRKNLEVAASYGELPASCGTFLEHDRVAYTIISPKYNGPVGWRTFKHPKLVENDIESFVANYDAVSSRPAKATLLTRGAQYLPITPESNDWTKSTGILLIEDIDQIWIKRLCVAAAKKKFMPFFIFGHILFDKVYKLEGPGKLVDQAKGWYLMSLGTSSPWSCTHCDVVRDERGGKLHFVSAQYPAKHVLNDAEAIRVSTFTFSEDLGKCRL